MKNKSEIFNLCFYLICFLIILIILVKTTVAVTPFGATLDPISNDTADVGIAGSHAAIAGNVTELNIQGFTVTQSWQGYYGNVSGTIFLADGSDSVMYNWSQTSPEGEVYASTNDSVLWTNIECFNFSSDGSYADDASQRGNTSFYGTNLTQLETGFNIEEDDVDGVNETFTLFGAGTHNEFYVNNLFFEEGECRSTRIFSNVGYGEDNKFEEVLLYDPDTRSVVFTSLLNDNEFGFNNVTHDFEMMVLEDGHGEDISSMTCYFYVEIQ